MRRGHQVSAAWHDEKISCGIVDLDSINNPSCSWWRQYCTRVIEMPSRERTTELNPPTRCHRSIFKFQVTHVGYGETWKEKGVVNAYSAKGSHPNYTSPCGSLKSFTSLDNTSLIWATKTSDVDIPYAVPKYQKGRETCRYWSAHPMECLRESAGPPQPSPLKIVRHSNIRNTIVVGN